ncbi:MAG: YdcF family protein [Lachnospiraceae bacterium]|nr:YdcF family protein [Lachnospiraceae bacterium]
MIYRSLALAGMAIFYILYFFKLFSQKKKGIDTYKLGKKSDKKKESKTETALKICTFILPVIELVSIIVGRSYLPIMGKVLGVYLIIGGDVIFLYALVSIKDSWRVGVGSDETDRKLVTNGIYAYSRNPAFLAFDLIYIGVVLMYCNIPLIVFTLLTIIMLHLQILNEEKFLESIKKEEYLEYKKHTGRYIGYKEFSFQSVRMFAYFFLFVWCIFYIITLVCYAGIFLSWIWIWLLIGAFAFLRFMMLKLTIDRDKRLRVPKPIKIIYYVLFFTSLIVFLFVETNIFASMNATPKKDLKYVIVLGAGLNGTTPSIPLVKRIEEGYQYMSDNPDTILIASGGKGFNESISEAECIKNELVRMGIDEDRIILEDKSTSTIENLKFSMQIIGDPNTEVGIITNSFHEYRAKLIAKSVGYENAYSVPAITLFPVGIHYMLREFFGVVRLWLELKQIVF